MSGLQAVGGTLAVAASTETPRDKELWHRPESPGKQLVQGASPLTQAHLRHLAAPLHRQQRATGREGTGAGAGARGAFPVFVI